MIKKEIFINLFTTFDCQYNAVESLYRNLGVQESIFDIKSALVNNLDSLALDIASAVYSDDWDVRYRFAFCDTIADALYYFVWALQRDAKQIVMITKNKSTGEETRFIPIESDDLGGFYDIITSPAFYHQITELQEGTLSAIEWEIEENF